MCKLVRFFYAAVPAARFRAWLVRRHLDACPRCGAAGARQPGWGGLVRPPEWISRQPSLWPEVERRMAERAAARPAPPASVRGRWPELAAAAGGAAAVAVLALLLGGNRPSKAVDPFAASRPPRVEVLSAEVEGLPARASVYQTKRASFIWYSRIPRKEG